MGVKQLLDAAKGDAGSLDVGLPIVLVLVGQGEVEARISGFHLAQKSPKPVFRLGHAPFGRDRQRPQFGKCVRVE